MPLPVKEDDCLSPNPSSGMDEVLIPSNRSWQALSLSGPAFSASGGWLIFANGSTRVPGSLHEK